MATLPDEEKLSVENDPEGEDMLKILEQESDEDAPTPDLEDMDEDAPEQEDDVELEDLAIPEEEDATAEEEIADILESRKEG